MYVKNQTFFILGISKSGYFASKFVLNRGGKCYIFEDGNSEKSLKAVNELLDLGAIKVEKENAYGVIEKIDVLVISPGVMINHDFAVYAKKMNKRIVGEMEFAFSCMFPPVVAVTGTNGKTTTVSLIKAIFDGASIKNELLGNIGTPVTERINEINTDTVCITEVSSFQLESVSDFKPHVACVLNISPDHLERHFSMENYIYLKKRIFKNQKESEYSVLNFDDDIVKNFYSDLRSRSVFVSIKEKVYGAYAMNGKIYCFDEYIMDVDELNLKGEHNLYNSLFAIVVAKLFGIVNEVIEKSLKEFRGVSHRLEKIAEVNGVIYIDDSKATNTASAITAVRSMEKPTVLILGGSEKGETYDELFLEVKKSNVIHTVITGASRINMIVSAGKVGLADYTVTENFASAVKCAKMLAEEGEIVLLSPACASFDEFQNFEERGDRFKELLGECIDK